MSWDAEAEANFALDGWQKVSPSQETDTYDGDWRRTLAERWAGQLGRAARTPESGSGLLELVDLIADALQDPTRIDAAGSTVGSRLVAMRATKADTLAGTLKVFSEHFTPEHADESVWRLLALLAAVTSGLAAAQQDGALTHELQRSSVRLERDLRISEARLREVCASIPVGVAICDLDGNLIDVNPALADMLDHSVRDLAGKSIHDLFVAEDADYLAAAYAELTAAGGPQRLRERRRLVRASGEEAWTNLCVSILRDTDGAPGYFLTTVQDISELQLLQERFQYQALHDVMTGLPNRQFFVTRLETALNSLPRDAELILYHLALDGFDVVNDGLGYQAGDMLVKSVARRIERLLEGEEAMAARFGGTEFGILLRPSPDTPGVAEFAALINEELSEPIYVNDHGIATTASIGVVRRSVSEGSPDAMMRAAEAALRRAKSAGHRQWALFDRLRDPQERVEARLAAMIPGALEMGEFSLIYRPVMELRTERMVGLQANLRWEPPDREPLDHAKCLDLAERTGVTLGLREWMLRTVWDQATVWHRSGSHPSVQVDLSVNQAADPDLVAAVHRLVGHQDPGDLWWLWVSFPMAVLLRESDEARESLELLGSMGLRTAAHDFRASPEELRLLRRMPVNAIRLAPELVELVHEAPEETEAQAVARMLPLVRSCDRTVVVDGISTAEQARWWHSVGCEVALGPRYGEPMPELDVPVIR